jgi:transposase
MIPVPSGAQVWLATGHTDMRKGFDGLGAAGSGNAQAQPSQRSSVRFPRLTRRADQGFVA